MMKDEDKKKLIADTLNRITGSGGNLADAMDIGVLLIANACKCAQNPKVIVRHIDDVCAYLDDVLKATLEHELGKYAEENTNTEK